MSERKSSKDTNVTRRDALKFLGGSAAATLAPRMASAAHQKNLVQHADVAVVGAGFAGMIAAKNLVRSGKRVVILEARDRKLEQCCTVNCYSAIWSIVDKSPLHSLTWLHRGTGATRAQTWHQSSP
jgi:threonine dehydrogenase-like Zn-dependent dehydrogenase